ncbi:glycosyltransferase family 2 protein [Phaeobacter inhibens]|uniref:glycosyltransferase family 2 protein n=1 Tax=Phaeobacter inhibens TaxID=221822 RepID=UPI000C9B110A|nr:glycosyltransferase family 2 protein [Phaeobacter inhibens]AUQ70058.1 Glycosyl transferase family 2 [Phaeobacter inhibens]UWR50256.1 glycosyltransferase family 2 protein [Phaeobacter inhibens]
MRYTLVATAKNEGPAILEWVAYHKMIGFETIIIYQNDSDDFTHETLKILRDMGEIAYFYNRAERGRHQVKAYKRAAQQAAFREAQWVLALDLDEFLLVRADGGTVQDLVDAMPECNQIMLNWKRFGGAGKTRISQDLVVETFTLAEDEARVKTHLTPFKAMFDPSAYTRCGVHRPQGQLIPEDQIRICNGSGLPLNAYEHRNFRAKDPGQRALAQINHYITKDAASFVLKSYRGSAHQANRAIDRKYWTRRNYNSQEDLLLAARADAIRDRMQELDAASGGRLLDLRDQAIELHRSRFDALMEDSATVYRDLYTYCLENPGLAIRD